MTNQYQNQNTTNRFFSATLIRQYISLPTLNVVAAIVLAVVGVLYLSQVNGTAVSGYQLRDLELQVEEAQRTHRQLELQRQARQSVSDVLASGAALGMVAVDGIEYVRLPGGTVASAR